MLPGQNLYDLARHYSITVVKDSRLNKGWVGQTIERAAHLTINNAAARDGHDFELKSTSLAPRGDIWAPKESIKITQMNPNTLLEETFETSVFWNKLARLIVVGCHHATPTACSVVHISGVDITNPKLVAEIRQFWEDVQHAVINGEIARHYNLGNADDLIELRPTGTGKQWSVCPVTGERFPARAFYATKRLIRMMLNSEAYSPRSDFSDSR